ncbi:MAG: hypothetical protein U1E76_12090 [Planctomycetota bacterium]
MTANKWLVGVVAVAFLGLVAGGVSVMAQDAPGGTKGAGQTKPGANAGHDRDAMQKRLAERNEKLMKAMADSKVTLGQAVTAAEELAKGKAFTASMRLDKDGKLGIVVRLFVDGQLRVAEVDPQSGKATLKEAGPAEKDTEGGG